MTYALGIDLGTTYTSVALARGGRAEVVALGYRATAVPTVVVLTEDGRLLVGDAAERRAAMSPDRVAREFKRRVGDVTPLLLGGTPVAVDNCLAAVLRWAHDTVAQNEGGPPAALTVTHPANWGEFKKDVLREALRLADLPGAGLLAEPVAAATWYAQAERLAPGAVVAVYDLGGGTFDAAVLRRTVDGRFETLGRAEGIERLGGIDVDEAVLGHVLRTLGDGVGEGRDRDREDPAWTTGMAQLRRACVDAKEALSAETSITIPVWLPGIHTEVLLRRTELEELVVPLLHPSVAALGRVIASAGLHPAQVDAVLLIGGSSRMPLIARQVSAGLQRPIVVDAHPKHPVALGAALDAESRLTAAPPPPPPIPPLPPVAVPPPVHVAPPPPPPAGSSSGPRAGLLVLVGVISVVLVAAVLVVNLLNSRDGDEDGGTDAATGTEGDTPGSTPGEVPSEAPEARFAWEHDLGEESTGNTVAVDDQRVYMADDQGNLTAFSLAAGTPDWTVPLSDDLSGNTPVRTGNLLLMGSSDGTYALNPATGEQLWKAADHWLDPPVAVNDLVIGQSGDTVTALDLATGQLRWENEATNGGSWADPVTVGGMLVIGSDDGHVSALDPATGQIRWVTPLDRGDVDVEQMGVTADAVAVVDEDQYVTLIDAATGQKRWTQDLGADTFDRPYLLGDDLLVSVEEGIAVVDPGTGAVRDTIDAVAAAFAPLPGPVPAIVVFDVQSLQAFDVEGRSQWTEDVPIDGVELTVGPTAIAVHSYDGALAVFTF